MVVAAHLEPLGTRSYGVFVVTLAEDLYLLALDDTGGRLLIDPLHLDLGLGGALLLDLAVRERVTPVDGHVAVAHDGPTGEPLLDGALTAIAERARAHDPDHWVRHLGRGGHQAVQDRLVDLGVLKREDGRVLRFFPIHRTREADGRLHHELVDHLHDAVVLGHTPSSETAALAPWLSPSGSTGTSSHARTGARSSRGWRRSPPNAATPPGSRPPSAPRSTPWTPRGV